MTHCLSLVGEKLPARQYQGNFSFYISGEDHHWTAAAMIDVWLLAPEELWLLLRDLIKFESLQGAAVDAVGWQ